MRPKGAGSRANERDGAAYNGGGGTKCLQTRFWTPPSSCPRPTELIASLDGEPEAGVEAAWLVEIDQRIKDVDEGRVQLRDWSDVKADVQGALRRK